MANQFKTSRKTELVALRVAEAASYLTVGSRKYFKDQLKHKRNGTTFDFVIRDAGLYERGIDISGTSPAGLVEKKVSKSLNVGNVKVATNLLEPITDADWDTEVAKMQGPKLTRGLVQDALNGTVGKTIDGVTVTDYAGDWGNTNTCFVGVGFAPLQAAQDFLLSVSDERSYGFINPQINTKLKLIGQGFEPTQAEPMFSKGLKGQLGDTQYRTVQFMPLLNVSAALVSAMGDCSGFTYVDNDNGTATITLAGVGAKIPRGYTIWVDGVYACDLVGDRTSELKAFVAIEDGANNGEMKVVALSADDFCGNGTKLLCAADGSALGANKAAAISALNTAGSVAGAVHGMEAGKYFAGQVRIDGAYEFETLDEIDASNADTERADNEGIVIFQNRAIDVLKGSNTTRWTSTVMAGIVEPRCVATVWVKDADANRVVVVQ